MTDKIMAHAAPVSSLGEPGLAGRRGRYLKGAKDLNAPSRPYTHNAFAILNPFGDLWGPEWFDTVGKAEAHLRLWWGGKQHNCEGFRIVPVIVTLTTPMTRGEMLEFPALTASPSPPPAPSAESPQTLRSPSHD